MTKTTQLLGSGGGPAFLFYRRHTQKAKCPLHYHLQILLLSRGLESLQERIQHLFVTGTSQFACFQGRRSDFQNKICLMRRWENANPPTTLGFKRRVDQSPPSWATILYSGPQDKRSCLNSKAQVNLSEEKVCIRDKNVYLQLQEGPAGPLRDINVGWLDHSPIRPLKSNILHPLPTPQLLGGIPLYTV